MSTTPVFFLALVSGYALPSLIWFLANRKIPTLWPKEIIEKPAQPKVEFLFSLLAVVIVLGMGQLYSAGYLLPSGKSGSVWDFWSWWLNNLIIYSPIFIVIYLGKQSLSTIFLSPKGIWIKLVYGVLATVVGLSLFLTISGNLDQFDNIIAVSFNYDNIKNFLPVFLEGVAIAFIFVRLKWVIGMKWAISIPAILFALAHVPRSLSEGSDIGTIIYFSVLTALITVIILRITHESRDVIWLGILHYFMDIAIGAFG